MQKTQVHYEPIALDDEFPITEPAFNTPPKYAHIHNCFEMGCCYSGTGGVFQIGAKLYSCNPGDVVFINEKEYHVLTEATPENSSWKFLNLAPADLLSGYISPEENLFNTCSFAGRNFKNVISEKDEPELIRLVHILFSELEKRQNRSSTYIRAMVWAVFSKLRDIFPDVDRESRNSAGEFARLYPALSHIARFSGRTLDIPQLAEMCNMSVATFRKHFQLHTGMLPLQYINAYRMKVAMSLLKNSNLQVVNIAYQSGFPTLSHFNRVFKKEMGCTPVEYRKTHSKLG
ncbi:MAG: helix-turn-helix transcriptional regulator [Lentisphaeria bacterium]|nr:helix-turn-helix transcriptional regulator [Lentisphaeria bacterium]